MRQTLDPSLVVVWWALPTATARRHPRAGMAPSASRAQGVVTAKRCVPAPGLDQLRDLAHPSCLIGPNLARHTLTIAHIRSLTTRDGISQS
jgi:hypothetical protein